MNLKFSDDIRLLMFNELIHFLSKYNDKSNDNTATDSEKATVEILYAKFMECKNELADKGFISY